MRTALPPLHRVATGAFAKDPPNATVSAYSKDGALIRDAVVVLKNPVLKGDQLTFDVQVLEGDLTGADGPAPIFIDIIGMRWTPVSYAGAARCAAATTRIRPATDGRRSPAGRAP